MGATNDYFNKLPIIALTANAISGQREMFLANGLDDFLAKPIETKKLDSILRKWIPKEKQHDLPQTANSATPQDINLSIKGVDVRAGLRNVGGNAAAYIDILYDFCRDAQNRYTHIKAALRKEDFTLYTVLVHAVKGAARAIGANDFARQAETMEQAANNRDYPLIKKQTDALLQGLDALVGRINTALSALVNARGDGDGDADAEIDPHALKLDVMRWALETLDITTVNEILAQCMSMPLGKKSKDFISEVEQDILAFEYNKAVEKINSLL
jgi:HPt (histidine-containing phosphotransfer) domain-containing protein